MIAFRVLDRLKDSVWREGMASRASLREYFEQLRKIMDLAEMGVYLPVRTFHPQSSGAFTLQVPWSPLIASLLEQRDSVGHGENSRLNIVYTKMSTWYVCEQKPELFQQSIVFRLRKATSRVLVGMLVWDRHPNSSEQLGLRICNCNDTHTDKLRTMMIDDVWANEQNLEAMQQLFLLAAIKTRLQDFYLESSSKRACNTQTTREWGSSVPELCFQRTHVVQCHRQSYGSELGGVLSEEPHDTHHFR
ncbi:hypothetical protein LTR81_002392 [Elasticomyces elasticus]